MLDGDVAIMINHTEWLILVLLLVSGKVGLKSAVYKVRYFRARLATT